LVTLTTASSGSLRGEEENGRGSDTAAAHSVVMDCRSDPDSTVLPFTTSANFDSLSIVYSVIGKGFVLTCKTEVVMSLLSELVMTFANGEWVSCQ
jgi:hypothetical protein